MRTARLRRRERPDYWPGFVDALSTLLLVIIFLLSVFMLTQFFLTRQVRDQDTVLSRLNAQLAELTELLALERAATRGLTDELSGLQANLTAAEKDKGRLQGLLDNATAANAAAGAGASAAAQALDTEKQLTARALAQVELLNQQIAALRRQIAALEEALEASETRDRESQTKLADLGRRLNVALAQRVQELQRYRSDFFGRLKEILGNRPEIRVVGDRFVFQSEVLFPVGSDQINDAGKAELAKIAEAIKEVSVAIPPEIAWTLRVDGHTDSRPLSGTGRFRSNWDLSAARAISVVQQLISAGVPANRLMAAGFGEFQPLEEGTGEDVLARNRRIEFRLTDR